MEPNGQASGSGGKAVALQAQSARPQGPVPETCRGETRVTNPSGQSSPGGGNAPCVMRRSTGTAPPSSTRAIPLITTYGLNPSNRNVGFDGQRHPRVASDVAKFHVIGKMAGDDVVPVPSDVDAGHLWGAVRVDRGQMDEPPGGHRRPGGLVESDGVVSHSVSSLGPSVAPAEVTGRFPHRVGPPGCLVATELRSTSVTWKAIPSVLLEPICKPITLEPDLTRLIQEDA